MIKISTTISENEKYIFGTSRFVCGKREEYFPQTKFDTRHLQKVSSGDTFLRPFLSFLAPITRTVLYSYRLFSLLIGNQSSEGQSCLRIEKMLLAYYSEQILLG